MFANFISLDSIPEFFVTYNSDSVHSSNNTCGMRYQLSTKQDAARLQIVHYKAHPVQNEYTYIHETNVQ